MARLDKAWAVKELNKFLAVTAQVTVPPSGGAVFLGTVMQGSRTEAAERAHVVEQILDRTLPGWSLDRPTKDEEFAWLRDKASRAKSAIERADEVAQRLGDDAPEMDASALHRWAWENARPYWNTGHFHQAVMQAAIRINAETQAKVGRMDLSETALFNESFSLNDPKEASPRLRITRDNGSRTYENLHRGARAFAEGLYAAIRNPGMHVPHDGGEEQLALEQLAAFSLLARWVDESEVVFASGASPVAGE